MITKKILAASLKDAMDQMRRELGEDAIILSNRTIKTHSGDLIEVLAAYSDGETSPELPAVEGLYEGSEQLLTSDKSSHDNSRLYNRLPLENMTSIAQVQDDIADMKNSLSILLDTLKYRYSASLSKVYSALYRRLRDAGFNEEESLRYIGLLSERAPFGSEEKAADALRQLIMENIQIISPMTPKSSCTTAAFIGTTGGGKTTVVAKLSALCKLLYKSNVLIVSADAYKVGGADQLQTFASIAGISFETAYSSQELRLLLKQEKPRRDFIFIDSVGRSQKDRDGLNDIRLFLEAAEADYVFLVQSATASTAVLTDVLHSFEALEPTALIMTKLDETVHLGEMATGLRTVGAPPLAYTSAGQSIPDDLEPVNPVDLSLKILP